MPRTSIRELVEGWRPRYIGASRKEKSRILDEFMALTGYFGAAAAPSPYLAAAPPSPAHSV